MELAELTKFFQKLGAEDPEGWAKSQINEGINQLGRYIFLREAWKKVLPEDDDHSWIDLEIADSERNFGKPCSGVGRALKSLIETGADRQEITDVVRGMQYELLFGLCYLLDGPEDLEPEVDNLSWGLFQLNELGQFEAPIAGLHESVLSMDPTGREMRPCADTKD